MKAEDIRNEYTKTYDKGFLNHGVRAWFYLQKGLTLMNEFKYLVAGILALYYTLQLDSYVILLAIFIVSIPVLTFIGWFHTHKMAKSMEWTAMMFSSYFARYNVDLSEKTVKLLDDILQELKNKGKI